MQSLVGPARTLTLSKGVHRTLRESWHRTLRESWHLLQQARTSLESAAFLCAGQPSLSLVHLTVSHLRSEPFTSRLLLTGSSVGIHFNTCNNTLSSAIFPPRMISALQTHLVRPI